MIKIVGVTEGSEYFAALAIVDSLLGLWPDLEKSDDRVFISVGTKLSGYQVQDVDITLCIDFRKERRFRLKRRAMYRERPLDKEPILVKNLLVAIEVKDHDERSVYYNGDNVFVRYSRGVKEKSKSATEQNISQLHSLRSYFSDLGQSVFVSRCLYLTGVRGVSVDSTIGAGFDGSDFLSAITQSSSINRRQGGFAISAGSGNEIRKCSEAPIFRNILPSALDRRRMDLIASKNPTFNDLSGLVGEKAVSLRGRGGAGKTIALLQLAREKFLATGRRSILLTYNHALAADIRRCIALLGMGSSPEEGGITVQTTMSFMYQWLNALGVVEDFEEGFDAYDRHCTEALELMKGGAISKDDIETIKDERSDRLDFDMVLIDEVQDWPRFEIELVSLLYSFSAMVVADGVDQMIRSTSNSWVDLISKEPAEIKSFKKSYRLKRNLSIFANSVAEEVGLDWRVGPNDQAAGGQIILLEGSITRQPDVVKRVLDNARTKGNRGIDQLICVPAADIITLGRHRSSRVTTFFKEQGLETWDGVEPTERTDFPRDIDQLRVVHYASCRGLEGWCVFLEALDTYWGELLKKNSNELESLRKEPSVQDTSDAAKLKTWLGLMIPLTRPIDTLVISFNDMASEPARHILNVADNYLDSIEIIRI